MLRLRKLLWSWDRPSQYWNMSVYFVGVNGIVVSAGELRLSWLRWPRICGDHDGVGVRGVGGVGGGVSSIVRSRSDGSTAASAHREVLWAFAP